MFEIEKKSDEPGEIEKIERERERKILEGGCGREGGREREKRKERRRVKKNCSISYLTFFVWLGPGDLFLNFLFHLVFFSSLSLPVMETQMELL